MTFGEDIKGKPAKIEKGAFGDPNFRHSREQPSRFLRVFLGDLRILKIWELDSHLVLPSSTFLSLSVLKLVFALWICS